MQRGSKCEHSQGHKQVWERTARVDIPTYPWYDSWYMCTCEYMYVYNNVLGVSTRKGTNIYVSSHNVGSYTKRYMIRCMYTNTFEYLYAKRFSVWALTRAQTSVRVQSTGWYTNVSVIWFLIYVYLWVYVYVYNDVLSASTRKGTDICEFAQHGFTFKSICNIKNVYLWVYLYIYIYVYKEVLTVSTRKGADICEFAQHGFTYKSICDMIWYVYTSEYMHVYNKVLTASTRKGTDICEFAQHGFTYKSICNINYVYLWVYLYICIQRGSNCASTRKGADICEFAQHGFTYKSICNINYVYLWVYLYIYIYVYKEVLTVSTRKGTDICEFAQHGVIHKSICNMKYVYLWVYLYIYIYVYKEVLSVSTRLKVCTGKGRDICDLAQLEFIYKSIYHTIWSMYTCGYMYAWRTKTLRILRVNARTWGISEKIRKPRFSIEDLGYWFWTRT